MHTYVVHEYVDRHVRREWWLALVGARNQEGVDWLRFSVQTASHIQVTSQRVNSEIRHVACDGVLDT